MKKILSLALLTTLFTFSACSSEENSEDISELENETAEQDESTETEEQNEDSNNENESPESPDEENISEEADSEQLGYGLGTPDAVVVPLVNGTVSDIETTTYARTEMSLSFNYPSSWEVRENYFNEGSAFDQIELQFTRGEQSAVLSFPPREGETIMFGSIVTEEFSYENDQFNFNITIGQADPEFYAEVNPELEINPNFYSVNVDILPKSGEWTETVSLQVAGVIDGESDTVLEDYRKDLEPLILHIISSIEV